MGNKEKILDIITSYSISLFIVSVFVLMFFTYIIKQPPLTILPFISMTSFGIFIVSVLLRSFLDIKNIDIDYFKNIMIGITGGLAVWIFSGIDFAFREDFWLSINTLLVKIGVSIMVVLIGYRLCKK